MQWLKYTTYLFVLWSFNNSAVYPYTGGLTLVPMLNVSSTYFLELSAVAYHLTWSSHGSRSKEPGMYSKSAKKLSLGLYHTQIRPHELDIVAISGLWLDIPRFGDGRLGFWLAH